VSLIELVHWLPVIKRNNPGQKGKGMVSNHHGSAEHSYYLLVRVIGVIFNF